MFKQFVEQYVPFADQLVSGFMRKRSLPRSVDIEEIRSAAYFGLVEAATRFKPEFDVCFKTFALRRINGAIIDYLRKLGWKGKGESCHMQSLDVPLTGNDACVVSDTIEGKIRRDDREEIFEVLSLNLKDQTKAILRYYYIEEVPMKEIGTKFDITEGRISQLIKEYKEMIRAKWTDEELRIELAA